VSLRVHQVPIALTVEKDGHYSIISSHYEPYFNLPNIQDVFDQMIFEMLLRIIVVPVSFIRQLRNADLILHDEIAASFVPYGQLFSSPQLPPPQ
jgi:hypothetical protein